jgi:hypothetical protein
MKIINGNLEYGFRALQLHWNQARLNVWVINWTFNTHAILESTSSPFTSIFSWPKCFSILFDVPNFVTKYEWILHVVSSRILRSNIVPSSLLTSVTNQVSFSDVGQISWYNARAKSEVQKFVFRILCFRVPIMKAAILKGYSSKQWDSYSSGTRFKSCKYQYTLQQATITSFPSHSAIRCYNTF